MNLVTSTANPLWYARRERAVARRIVHVPRRFSSSHWNATETAVLDLAQQQRSAGMDPVIITTLAPSETRHEFIKGIRVHRHPHTYPFLESGGAPVPSAEKLQEHLLAIPVFQSLMQEPEVRLFHTHTLGRLGGEVRKAARMRGRPFVVSVHGHPIRIPAMHGDPHVQDAITARMEAGKSSGTFSVSQQDLEEADMLIFPSKIQADRALAALGHDRIAYLPEGVDCARFSVGDGASFRARHEIPQDAFVIGCFGGLELGKFTLLLEAFAQAAARRPAKRLHLVVTVSTAQNDEAAQFNALIQERGLGGTAHVLLEWREPQQANHVHALHACDAVTILSRSSPARPTVLEAWSAGRPVIAGRNEGAATLLTDEDTGLLFDLQASDGTAPQALAACLERVVIDEALRDQLTVRGRSEVVAHHDWSRVSTRLEEIYQLAEKHHGDARAQGRRAA